MTSSTSSTSAAGLSQTSQPWTAADNAAGFVLRYLIPMREHLLQGLGDESIADESLKRLISHLITQGFGAHGKGRIRDFLMRGIRSAAKSVVTELPEAKRPKVDFATWTPDSAGWLAHWRNGLLTRAWRCLERAEHKDPTKPFYTVLRAATDHRDEDAAMLAVRINTQSDVQVDPKKLAPLLVEARKLFAQMLEIEVAETLDQLDAVQVQNEVEALGLVSIFTN